MSTPPVLRPQDPSQIPPALAALLAPTSGESEPLFAGTPIPGTLKGMLPPDGAEEKVQASNSPAEGLDAPQLGPATSLPDALKVTTKPYKKADGSVGETAEGYDTPTAAPTLDKGGFLKRLGRVAGGFFGMTPEGSETGDSKLGGVINRVVGGLGNTMTAIGGTPQERGIAAEERLVPLKLAQLNNEMQYRRGLLGIGQQNANSKAETADIAQQKVDEQQRKNDSVMRLRGYVPDPVHPGAYAAMNEDQVLADPILSKDVALKESAANAKDAATTLSLARADALMNPNNPTLQLKLKDIESRYALANSRFQLQLHSQDRQDKEFLYNFGTPVSGPSGDGVTPSGQPSSENGLSLNNAPDMMMVDPTTGLPIPMKMLASMKPTQQEIQRANFAKSAMASADRIGNLVEQAKASVGPFSGRVQDLMARAGVGDQFNQELQNYIRFTQSAATAAHTGRFSVPILDKMDKVIDPSMNPDQLGGAIASIKAVMAPYADEGWKPSVAEYRAYLQGNGTTPSGKKATNPASPNASTPKQSLTNFHVNPTTHQQIGWDGKQWVDVVTGKPAQ